MVVDRRIRRADGVKGGSTESDRGACGFSLLRDPLDWGGERVGGR